MVFTAFLLLILTKIRIHVVKKYLAVLLVAPLRLALNYISLPLPCRLMIDVADNQTHLAQSH